MKTFAEQVYAITRKVPCGKVTTYKVIAEVLGTHAYRAVGQALNKNPYAPEVPCHRVVASDGSLGGFAHGRQKKIELLHEENVFVKHGFVENFEQVFYDF